MERFPLTYIPYQWSWLLKDIIAGLTLLTVLIPQSMAYAALADLSPVIGLYSSLAVLPFAIFASNDTCTVGPFTVTQILMKSLRPIYLGSLIGGFMQILISPFSNLISIWLLPGTFMSGFTTGCAFLIVAAQVDDFFGISLVKPTQFTVVLKVIDIFYKIQTTHILTFLVSMSSLIVIYLLKKLNVYLKSKPKFSKIWIPDVFIVCLIATLLSYFLNFSKHGIRTVGPIPKGFPDLFVPWKDVDFSASTIGSLIVETLPVAIVSSSITLSVLTQYTTPNTSLKRDMFLLGTSSILISFFQGFMATGSLTRAALQKEVGAKTQISNIVMSILLILVLISISPIFENVPMASLAAIVMLAARSLLLQIHKIGWPLLLSVYNLHKQTYGDIELNQDCVQSESPVASNDQIETSSEEITSTATLIARYEHHPYIQALYFWFPCFGIFFFNVQYTLAASVSLIILWKLIYAVRLKYL